MPKDPNLGAAERAGAPQAFEIRQSFWGYVIRGTGGPPMMLQVAQGVVLAFGATFTAASLVLLMAPGAESAGPSGMRQVLSALLAAFALLLVWFATRGAMVEMHLDLARGELRELVRHRVGRSTVLARHALDGMASLHLVHGDRRGAPGALVLRLHGKDQGICIAQGPETALMELRRRLSQDLRFRNLTLAREVVAGRLRA